MYYFIWLLMCLRSNFRHATISTKDRSPPLCTVLPQIALDCNSSQILRMSLTTNPADNGPSSLGSPGFARMYLRVSLDHLALYLYFHQVGLLVPIFKSWGGTVILIYLRMATAIVNSQVKTLVGSFFVSLLFHILISILAKACKIIDSPTS
jgi:hypothetical protein